MIQEVFNCPILVFGCGNQLLGDDGFGPAVIEHLHQHHKLPQNVAALDVGTGIRNFLFDLLLLPRKPKSIFIVDAVSQADRKAGDIFELHLHQLPFQKANDFSLHQFPSVNLLDELQNRAGVNVRVLAVQAKDMPDGVRPGISSEVRAAVPKACIWLLQQIEGLHDSHPHQSVG